MRGASYNPNAKPNPVGQAISGAMKNVGSWINKGAPLPGATQPPAGKSYLRGRLVPSYKKGGIVKKTGLALVHRGEKVIPNRCVNCKSTEHETKNHHKEFVRSGIEAHKAYHKFESKGKRSDAIKKAMDKHEVEDFVIDKQVRTKKYKDYFNKHNK